MTKDVINFLGRSECQCKPITDCHWILKLRKFSDVLPHRNRLRQKVVDLIKKSICNKHERTVYCCDDETLVIRKLKLHDYKVLTRISYYDRIKRCIHQSRCI